MNRRQTIIDKIYTRVSIEDRGYKDPEGNASPCHIWIGPTSGTGRMCLDGQTVATHLVVYTHYHGYIPKTKQIDHLCNQRPCCNPQHVEMVTHRQNQRRKTARQ